MNIEMKRSNEYRKIIDELVFIGYSLKHKGTYILAEAIYEVYNNKNQDILDNVEGNIYFKLAKKYNQKIGTIKSNIVKATNNMYLVTDVKRIKEYFGFCDDIKPTPKLIIATIINKI